MAKVQTTGGKRLNLGTQLLPCTCVNEFQDKRYKGKRVHNGCSDGWRCTSCNTKR